MERMTAELAIEHSPFKFRLESAELEEGMFKGMASVFDVMIDSFVPTVIERNAFDDTLARPKRVVRILWQHMDEVPIGLPIELTQTEEGLSVIAKVSNTAAGRDAMTLLRDGVVQDLSIGWDPVDFRFEKQANGELVRFVSKIDLWEISVVTFPANKSAKITEVQKEVLHKAKVDLGIIARAPKIELADPTTPEEMAKRFGAIVNQIKTSEDSISGECLKTLSDAVVVMQSIIEREHAESPDAIAARSAAELAEAVVGFETLQ